MFNEQKWSEPQAHISSNRWFSCSPGLHNPVLGVGSGPPWDGRGPPTESPPPHPAASSIQVFPGPTPAELPGSEQITALEYFLTDFKCPASGFHVTFQDQHPY